MIAHHLKNVGQKSMKLFLMKQILLILQCLYTIWLNILIEYIDYSDTSGSLWGFKRDEVANNANAANNDNTPSFK